MSAFRTSDFFATFTRRPVGPTANWASRSVPSSSAATVFFPPAEPLKVSVSLTHSLLYRPSSACFEAAAGSTDFSSAFAFATTTRLWAATFVA